MSTTVGIGVPVPKMLPITGTWATPFAAYLVLLSQRITYHRLKNEKYLGDSLGPATDKDNQDKPDPLFLATRAHNNYLENIPLAFLLTAVAELNGGNRKVLNWALGILLALRIAHVEVGMKGKQTVGPGRPVAFYFSQLFLGGMAAYSTYLIKGYWGF
ncbi:MAG: hypothetical protein M1833_000554 [Piccolia ochrophora]|nr:MAG: hypothetical protein M1833_000554 [Piccolia ochrophora]